jgi:hypothetical protein
VFGGVSRVVGDLGTDKAIIIIVEVHPDRQAGVEQSVVVLGGSAVWSRVRHRMSSPASRMNPVAHMPKRM